MGCAAVFSAAPSVGAASSPRVAVPSFPCAGSGGWWARAGGRTVFSWWQHCLHMAAAVPSECGSTAFSWWHTFTWQGQCLHNVAAPPSVGGIPSHGSGSAFTMWQPCLQSVVPLPLQCCMPLECCSTAFQHCSAASGLQHLCLWTAAALLLDSDTGFPMGQHRLQLVAAMPSHGSGSAFTVWQHCLTTVVPLPLQCCMPLESCSTASEHCSTASGPQPHCLQNVTALPVDGRSTVVGQ